MTNLTDTIKLYETKLSKLKSTTKPSFEQVVSVLLTRDEIQYFMEEDDAEHTQNLEEIKKNSEIEARFVEIIILNWSKKDFREIYNRNYGYSYYAPKPIEYTYKAVNTSPVYQTLNSIEDGNNPTVTNTRDNKFRKILIDKYSQLPEYKKLNFYVRIDNYLNTIEIELKNLRLQ
ncbi:MAG: hypothetical protein F6K22_04995 [Okeania sp. SIO2F4]|uniref:hypothetical protein n=1 Tax=Okeania sp. SIO2F4 TaxID=2607790 RepID=UPI00142BBDD2|nr:hypothetical protein [Okeania sp. SIO2F4]NES02248.1 hypothetical protein [Okeania sp. SIO2F4]